MYHPVPRHPLRSFRFWFLVLGCGAATTAWRMGWLPEVHVHRRHDPAVTPVVGAPIEIQLNRANKSAAASRTGGAEGLAELQTRSSAEAPSAVPDQTEPAATAATPSPPDLPAAPRTPQWETAASSSPQTALPGERSSAPAGSTTASPFGPAHLEFVPADALPSSTIASPTEGTQRFPASPGMIQQVGAVEGEPGVRAAAILGKEPAPEFPQPATPQIDWVAIDRMIAAGQDVEAHRVLSSLYWEQPDLRDKLASRINQTAQRIYFLPHPHYIDPYTIQAGDQLQNIANNYRVSWQYLAKLNRLDPLRIRPGQNLKVILGPFGAVVDLRRFELTVHAHGYYVARFPIGIGKDSSTPVGDFTVQDKLEDPTYYGPDGVIAHDDPRNPLGEFWISLGDGYGIHGTIDESSIGRAESRGCIRLRNQDVADLFDLLTVGSSVVIRR